MSARRAPTVPVIALVGHLGAGKTTLLNHVLRTPDARIGVVINDFGELNVDAGLVSGQVDEPLSIAGGCICHLPDDGVLDRALERLSDPTLALDAIIVEASGIAEPMALTRMIRFSGVERIRPGGVVDVVDAIEHFATVDTAALPPVRYAAASLVVVNKLDRVPEAARAQTLASIESRVRERNPGVQVVGAVAGRVDPRLLFDVAHDGGGPGQTSLRELLVEERHDHPEARSVTVRGAGPVDPGALVDLLERPPAGVYRMKGTVTVGARHYLVNVVGSSVHVATSGAGRSGIHLVAIGNDFDRDHVRDRLERALRPGPSKVSAVSMRRLQRLRTLSL